jgi:16S rRNA (cytidine1402-2'-O)-methyltransferase
VVNLNQIKFPEIQNGTLYLIATPIGNLGDITLRALHTLKNVDIIYCEDTRVSQQLLKAYDIKKPLYVYHDHSRPTERQQILKKLQSGLSIALLSDAGTPLISDPGYKVVEECHQNHFPVTLIPGACALIDGLVISGLPTDQFYFGGFLPLKEKDRQQKLSLLSTLPATLVFYETAPKLLKTLQDFDVLFRDRLLVIARELTKKFETIHRDTVHNLLTYYTNEKPPKGELVLVLEGHSQQPGSLVSLSQIACKKMLEKMSTKEAADILSLLVGHPKNTLYQELLKFKNDA